MSPAKSCSLIFLLNTIIVLLGVVFFSSLFRDQCTLVIDSMEFRHNHSLSEIETLCDQAKSDNQKCLEDTEHNAVTISELRGRLEGHAHAATLAPKYNLLLENHLKAGRLIEELQSLLKEKQDDLDKRIHVNREQKDALNVAEELRRTYEATVNHIQKRQSALCRESFGLGPYYVHFSIIFDGGQKRTFVVEVPSRVHLPHSTHTFLSLIESKIYDGFIIKSKPNYLSIEMGSDPEVAIRSKALGFGDTALTFLEASNPNLFSCEKYSVGFSAYGPTLKVFLNDNANDDTDNTDDAVCFGRVMRGEKTLLLMDTEIRKGTTLRITKARYLQFTVYWIDCAYSQVREIDYITLQAKKQALYKCHNKMSLSTDGVRKIISMTASSSDPGFNPVFQCISVKSVGSSGSGPTRYRAILSDGTFYVQGMLATQLNSMVESEELKTNAVISVQDFMKNSVQGRNVIILLKLTVLSNPGERIGAPENIENAGASAMRNNSSANGVKAAPMYNRTNTPENNAYNQGKPKPQSNANPKNPYSPATNRPNAPIVHQGNNGTPGGTPITPISQLNMYQNRWTIKARVVSKGDIRTWSNARGEGSLFSVELLDSSGMDIKATFFKDAVDKFFNQVDVGQVYHISGGRVKVANMQYNTCKSKYELNFDQNSEVRLVDDVGDIQAQSFELVKIADLERVDAGKNVDVIAVVQEIGEVQSLTSKKSGQELTKCDLTLIDDTGVQVRLTLWGKQAMGAKNDIALQQVVAFRKARVSDYGGVSLSGGSGVFVEPQIPETNSLKQWWETQGSKGGAVKSLSATYGGGGKMDSFSDRKTIADIKTEGLGYNSEKGDYLTFKAHFSFLKKDKEGGAWYTACPNKEDPCRNRVKVTQTTDGNWQCDRCQRTYQECSHKWIFSGTVADDTSSTWVSIFDDQAMVLFGGATADEAFAQFENQDFYDSHFAKAVHTEWILKCKVKSEMVNEEPRLKAQVVRMDPVDYAAECRDMLNEIQKFQ